jgi:hypothetical protein
MATDIDLELTDQDFQIVISKPEDFFDAELEVATVHLDVIENGLNRTLEHQVARIMTRKRCNPSTTHPKILIDEQIIDEKALVIAEKVTTLLERVAGIRGKKTKVVQKMA